MMEPIQWTERPPEAPVEKPWAADGRDGPGGAHTVTSLRLKSDDNERFVLALQDKYRRIEESETRWEATGCEGAQVILAAFGTTARIALSAARKLEKEGIRAGLFRPVTLWPFPQEALRRLAMQEGVRAVLTVEMNLGQMLTDVRLAVEGRKPVRFFGRTGGMVPSPAEVADAVRELMGEVG